MKPENEGNFHTKLRKALAITLRLPGSQRKEENKLQNTHCSLKVNTNSAQKNKNASFAGNCVRIFTYSTMQYNV